MSAISAKWPTVLFVGVLVGGSVSTMALAERKFDAADVEGVYPYVATYTRDSGEHCQSYGTLTFDGIDEVRLDSNDACDGGPVKSETHFRDYDVDLSGQVRIFEVSDGSTDCQLVNKGDTLLCHGANRSDLWNLMAVGARVD